MPIQSAAVDEVTAGAPAIGVSPRRAWVATGVWGGGVFLLLAASGVGTRYRVPVVAGGVGILIALLGLLTIAAVIRSADRRFLAVVAGVVVAAGVVVQLVTMAAAPTVIVERDSDDGAIHASLEAPKVLYVVDSGDTLTVRVVRTGIVSKDLGSFCVFGTSGAPSRARIDWTDSHSFTVTMPVGYGYGPWHFRVEGDRVRPTGRVLQPC